MRHAKGEPCVPYICLVGLVCGRQTYRDAPEGIPFTPFCFFFLDVCWSHLSCIDTADFVPTFCSGNRKARQGKDLASESEAKARQGNITAMQRQGKVEGKAKAKQMHTALQQTWPENLLWCSVVNEDQRLSGASPAQRLEQLLKELATDLGNTDLPMQQQHWVLFSVLGAYMYCMKFLEDSITAEDEETDAMPMRLHQVLHHTSQVYPICAGHRHVW